MTQTHFILVRHGETTWNLEGRRQGQSDSPLTARGLAQARAIAARLAAGPAQAVALYSSDLPRAWRTAAEISATCGLPVVGDERLREKSFGVIEGLTQAEVEARYPQVAARLAEKSPDYVPPGGESLAAAQQRGINALADLAQRHAGGRVIVVSHGALLGMFLRHVLGLALTAPRRFTLENGSLSFVAYQHAAEVWHVTSFGEVSHLQAALSTS